MHTPDDLRHALKDARAAVQAMCAHDPQGAATFTLRLDEAERYARFGPDCLACAIGSVEQIARCARVCTATPYDAREPVGGAA